MQRPRQASRIFGWDKVHVMYNELGGKTAKREGARGGCAHEFSSTDSIGQVTNV